MPDAIDALQFVGFGVLAMAVIGWALERSGAAAYLADVLLAPETEEREPLAGPDDEQINFGAALRCGPLPKWGEENNRDRAAVTAGPATAKEFSHGRTP